MQSSPGQAIHQPCGGGGTPGCRRDGHEAFGRPAIAGIGQDRAKGLGEARLAGQPRRQAKAGADPFQAPGDARLIEDHGQGQHGFAGRQGVQHGIETAMGNDGIGAGNGGFLGREVGDPGGAIVEQAALGGAIQPPAVGDQHLNVQLATGLGDAAEQR